MKNLKKIPTKQLEKFSNIFTQLGLVLVLFIVYLTLEHKTPQTKSVAADYDIPDRVILEPDQDIIFVKQPKTVPKPKTTLPQIFILDEVVKGDNNVIEHDFLDDTKDNFIEVTEESIVEVEIKEEIVNDVPYDFIQEAPVFKGCEGLSKTENKKCFDKKMKRFVQRNFDADLASDLGLNSGKYKIHTQFIIDDKGNVMDIKIRAPHTKLKKETQQLIEKLPKFTPGKQNDKNVRVRYTLPISFQVD
ncbi:energy transducer TonB [Polaribacter ponticola]|uniref:Energy transducer TonB n=1 Tax=Polaribacter ponticola TaxID=2978475 RepID=A0ABT5SBD6_9FLAO|nr:energy transducer TonB [Polaribacter sp. MSW5]MDD7915398.1 energy transducer TonB [Polaribacter sp. MSW5]